MKSMYFFLPTLPATIEERRTLRPIANDPERWQRMIQEVDDVRRSIDAMVENVHPEWLVWQGDQGFLPVAEVKRQVRIFGEQVLPRYK